MSIKPVMLCTVCIIIFAILSVGVDTTSPVYRISLQTTFLVFLPTLLFTAKWGCWGSPTLEAAKLCCPWVNLGSAWQTPTFFSFWPWILLIIIGTGAGSLQKLLILMLYFYSGDEYFLSSIVSWGDLTIEKNVGDLIKDESYIITKSLLGWEASQEHEHPAFLYVEVMWMDTSRSELVQEFYRKSSWISRITCTLSTG